MLASGAGLQVLAHNKELLQDVYKILVTSDVI